MGRILRKGIVVTTSENTKQWLKECLDSIGFDIDVLIVGNNHYEPPIERPNHSFMVNNWNGFELGGILRGMQCFDEFIYIPDTVIIKDNDVLKEILKHDGGMMLSPNFLSYIGKYNSEVLRQIGVPKITSKKEAVDNEFSWTETYRLADNNLTVFREMLPSDTHIFREKNGRNNMVNECSWATKYKGCWSTSMI